MRAPVLAALLFLVGCGVAQDDGDASSAEALAEGDRLRAAAIAGGSVHTCAVLGDGRVRCWGANAFGEAGRRQGPLGGDASRGAIGVAKFPGKVLRVAAGTSSSCAVVLARPGSTSTTLLLPDDGVSPEPSIATAQLAIYCWGQPNVPLCNVGAPGAGPSGADDGAPQLLCSDDLWTMPLSAFGSNDEADRVAITAFAMNALDDLCVGKLQAHRDEAVHDGQVTLSATKGAGMVCFRGMTRTEFPALANKMIRKIGMGPTHTCALADDGLYCWGRNAFGQLGNGTTVDATAPVRVTGLPGDVKDVAVGSHHTCAVTSQGTFCAGNDTFGSLGDGAPSSSSSTFVRVQGLPDAAPTAIEAGQAHTCAIAAGDVYCWGDNSFSACGNGVDDPTGGSGKVWQRTAAKVRGIVGRPRELALGVWSSCVLTDAGAQCWGANDDGQLGRGARPHASEVDPDFVRATPAP